MYNSSYKITEIFNLNKLLYRNHLQKSIFLKVYNISIKDLKFLLVFLLMIKINCNESENGTEFINRKKATRYSFRNKAAESKFDIVSLNQKKYLQVKIPAKNENDDRFLRKLSNLLESPSYKYYVVSSYIKNVEFMVDTDIYTKQNMLIYLDKIINQFPSNQVTISLGKIFNKPAYCLNLHFPLNVLENIDKYNFNKQIDKIRYFLMDVGIEFIIFDNKNYQNLIQQ